MNSSASVDDLLPVLCEILENPTPVEATFETDNDKISMLKKNGEENKLSIDQSVKKFLEFLQASKSLDSKLELLDKDVAECMRDLKQKEKLFEEEQASLLAKQQTCSEMLRQQSEQKERLSELKRTLNDSWKTELTKQGAIVRLYREISKIRWSPNASAQLCEGYIAGKDDIKPFSLNTTDHSHFFITNYLWDLMDE